MPDKTQNGLGVSSATPGVPVSLPFTSSVRAELERQRAYSGHYLKIHDETLKWMLSSTASIPKYAQVGQPPGLFTKPPTHFDIGYEAGWYSAMLECTRNGVQYIQTHLACLSKEEEMWATLKASENKLRTEHTILEQKLQTQEEDHNDDIDTWEAAQSALETALEQRHKYEKRLLSRIDSLTLSESTLQQEKAKLLLDLQAGQDNLKQEKANPVLQTEKLNLLKNFQTLINQLEQQKEKLEQANTNLELQRDELQQENTQFQEENSRFRHESYQFQQDNRQLQYQLQSEKKRNLLYSLRLKEKELEANREERFRSEHIQIPWWNQSDMDFMKTVGYTITFNGSSYIYTPPQPCSNCTALGKQCQIRGYSRLQDHTGQRSVVLWGCYQCRDPTLCSLVGRFKVTDDAKLVRIQARFSDEGENQSHQETKGQHEDAQDHNTEAKAQDTDDESQDTDEEWQDADEEWQDGDEEWQDADEEWQDTDGDWQDTDRNTRDYGTDIKTEAEDDDSEDYEVV